jgi:hypothetical protein
LILIAPKLLTPIKPPTDCNIMQDVYNSAGLYLKSICIDIYERNYDESRLNCLKRGMQIYKTDSLEAKAVVLDVADINWSFKCWSVSLHISANATGPLFVSNLNPSASGFSQITNGNRTACTQSVCEFININRELNFFKN